MGVLGTDHFMDHRVSYVVFLLFSDSGVVQTTTASTTLSSDEDQPTSILPTTVPVESSSTTVVQGQMTSSHTNSVDTSQAEAVSTEALTHSSHWTNATPPSLLISTNIQTTLAITTIPEEVKCPSQNKLVCSSKSTFLYFVKAKSYTSVSNSAYGTSFFPDWPAEVPLMLRSSNTTKHPTYWVKGANEAKAAAAVGSIFVLFIVGEILILLACDFPLFRRQCRTCARNIRERRFKSHDRY